MTSCPGTGRVDEYRDVRGPIESKPSNGIEVLEEEGVNIALARAIIIITITCRQKSRSCLKIRKVKSVVRIRRGLEAKRSVAEEIGR